MAEFKYDEGISGSVGGALGNGPFGIAGTLDTVGQGKGTLTVGATVYGIGVAVSVNIGTGDWSVGAGGAYIVGDGIEPGPTGVGSYVGVFGGLGFSNEGLFAELDAALGFGPLASRPSQSGMISGIHVNARITRLYDEIPPEYVPPSGISVTVHLIDQTAPVSVSI